MTPSSTRLIERDSQYVIHPYAPPTGHLSFPPLPVSHTNGCKIILEDGSELIDAMSSWWGTIHGYNNPHLLKAVQYQLNKMPHVMFGGLTHEPAVALAEKLVKVMPDNLKRVFFADSGSVAVEVAIKIALQYWQSKGTPRNTLLTVRGGYHGDTFGAMAVCDPINGMHSHFSGVLCKHLFAPRPYAIDDENTDDIDAFKAIIHKHRNEIAAVILEPILQGAGGMHVYRSEYLKEVRNICDCHGILLIADEIATGFGRTSMWLGCDHANVTPDILCLGKALTGGLMSFAATMITDEIAKVVSNGSPGLLMHGPTFMGNPLASSAALASLEILEKGAWKDQVKSIEKHLQHSLLPLKCDENVVDVRVIGAVGVVELKQAIPPDILTPILLKNGVWLRPFNRLLYTMPPYVIQKEELKKITDTITLLAKNSL